MNASTLTTFNEALSLLDSFINFERTPAAAGLDGYGTERMANLLRRLDSPHLVAPVAHIAGTKGKGSTAFLVSAALSGSGLKTGLYTSPHVDSIRERIMINGRPISERQFAESCQAALSAAEDMRADGHEPTYFEVLTATAFHAFHAVGVEAMVLETGLGGRLDATNLPDLRVAVTAITPVSLDHEEILGKSVEEIAREKAGIIRAGVPLVVGQQTHEAMRVIIERAETVGAPVFRTGEDIIASVRKEAIPDRPELGQRLDLETWRSLYPDVVLSLLGEHQVGNAAVALGMVELFLEGTGRDPLDSLALKRSWRGLVLPARLEVFGQQPWVIVDGAHNPASAWSAAETILSSFTTKDRVLVFGAAEDKNVKAMLRILAPLFKTVIMTSYNSPRSASPRKLQEFLKQEFPAVPVLCASSPAEALAEARKAASADGLILFTGSLYLAGEIRAACRQTSGRRRSR